MVKDYAKLLSHPFPARQTVSRATIQKDSDDSISNRFSKFRNITEALEAHLNVSSDLIRLLYLSDISDKAGEMVEEYAPGLREQLENIRKQYRIFVETAKEAGLNKEVERLLHRFFQDETGENEAAFIRIKRFLEKIRTFNEKARKSWKTIQKSIDTLQVMTETSHFLQEFDQNDINDVMHLCRQTDNFLDALSNYVSINHQSIDPVTGTTVVELTYNPTIDYSFGGFFGDIAVDTSEGSDAPEALPFDIQLSRVADGSIARSIMLESRERKLNRSTLFSVPLLGSRNWNRTTHYVFETPVSYFQQSLEQFNSAYHVNLPEMELRQALNPREAADKKGTGEKLLGPYIQFIEKSIEELSEEIVTKDFPGLEKPDIFLYHTGPRVLYKILLSTLKERNLGDIFILTGSGITERQFPEELIKKILIEWWIRRFKDLSLEDVDAYIVYSRSLEMVRKDYRALLETEMKKRKEKFPDHTYGAIRSYIRENRSKTFGIRKWEVFGRFLSEVQFE